MGTYNGVDYGAAPIDAVKDKLVIIFYMMVEHQQLKKQSFGMEAKLYVAKCCLWNYLYTIEKNF